MARRLPGAAAAALLVLSACGGDVTQGPPDLQYGLEECGFCRMIISREELSAAAVDELGTAVGFDDLGCLLDYLQANPQPSMTPWVHDYAGGGWIAATEAWFVRGPRTATPMGSGLVAFASRSAAQTFADEHGSAVLDWAELSPRESESGPA